VDVLAADADFVDDLLHRLTEQQSVIDFLPSVVPFVVRALGNEHQGRAESADESAVGQRAYHLGDDVVLVELLRYVHPLAAEPRGQGYRSRKADLSADVIEQGILGIHAFYFMLI